MDKPPVYYTIDGEDIVLNAYMTPRNRKILKDKLVILAKGGCSNSRFNNALDSGNIHKATKKVNKHTSMKDVAVDQAANQKYVDELLKEQAGHIPKGTRDDQADAIVKLVHVYQGVLRKSIIQHSFVKSGQSSDTSGKFSLFDAQVGLFPGKLSAQEGHFIASKKDAMIDLARKHGKLTEEDFRNHKFDENLNLPENTDRRTKDKDKRPIINQRYMIINHPDVCKEYDTYMQGRIKAPKPRKEEAELVKSHKAADKADAAMAKKAAKEAKAAAAALLQVSTTKARKNSNKNHKPATPLAAPKVSKEEQALSNIKNRKRKSSDLDEPEPDDHLAMSN